MSLKKVWFVSLLLLSFPGVAQRVRMPDLVHYAQSQLGEFEMSMLRQGFVCYQSSGGLRGWTCLFAYQPTPFLTPPDQAAAVILFDRNSRSDVIQYQLRSTAHYRTLLNELQSMGYRMESKPSDRCIFSRGNTTVTCRQTDNRNGMSGNYSGHTITLIRQRY